MRTKISRFNSCSVQNCTKSPENGPSKYLYRSPKILQIVNFPGSHAQGHKHRQLNHRQSCRTITALPQWYGCIISSMLYTVVMHDGLENLSSKLILNFLKPIWIWSNISKNLCLWLRPNFFIMIYCTPRLRQCYIIILLVSKKIKDIEHKLISLFLNELTCLNVI